jgi:hypothetical protein
MCSSGKMWVGEEGVDMDPGRACIDCHANGGGGEEEEGGPLYLVAGTVFPTAHEPDNCFGLDGTVMPPDVSVEVRDGNGNAVVLKINAAGNFYLDPYSAPAGFAPPYAVKVVKDDLERPMGALAPHGDCNLCHTQDGTTDAPGRIIPP